MRVPVIHGIIDRRILVNYRIDPDVLARIIPPPFRPKLINNVGIAGICLIRLKEIRPRAFPRLVGFSSENAAHRIAVEWEENGLLREGVYIPRRDTSSRWNTLLGGRLFPGMHHQALFDVVEGAHHYSITIKSEDSEMSLAVEADLVESLPQISIFNSLAEASDFFEAGSLGYSDTTNPAEFDGLELQSFNWLVEPLTVSHVHSSFFENNALFPEGSIEFDCALLIRGIEHEWQARESLCVLQTADL